MAPSAPYEIRGGPASEETVNVLGGISHTGLGWLVPVVIIGFVFSRPARRR